MRPEAGDLADGAGGDLGGGLVVGREVSGSVGGADLLVALPGEQGFVVGVAAAQAPGEPIGEAEWSITRKRSSAPAIRIRVPRCTALPRIPRRVQHYRAVGGVLAECGPCLRMGSSLATHEGRGPLALSLGIAENV